MPYDPSPVNVKPYIPASAQLPEMTFRALVMGVVLGMVFGASSLYLVLKVGLTVSASIPVAVIAITLFGLTKKVGGRDSTILENSITQTAGSAARSYFVRAHDPTVLQPGDRIRVPTGVALTTEAAEHTPREWAERRYADIRRWTEFPRGRHFPAMEAPADLAADLRAFFGPLQ